MFLPRRKRGRIGLIAPALCAKRGQPASTPPKGVFMRVRIYQPARNVMQSGARSKGWVLEFPPADPRALDPLMGWTSSDDTQSQVRLRFRTREEAEAYAKDKGLDYVTTPPKSRAQNIRPRGYGENFATDRRAPWPH